MQVLESQSWPNFIRLCNWSRVLLRTPWLYRFGCNWTAFVAEFNLMKSGIFVVGQRRRRRPSRPRSRRRCRLSGTCATPPRIRRRVVRRRRSASDASTGATPIASSSRHPTRRRRAIRSPSPMRPGAPSEITCPSIKRPFARLNRPLASRRQTAPPPPLSPGRTRQGH